MQQCRHLEVCHRVATDRYYPSGFPEIEVTDAGSGWPFQGISPFENLHVSDTDRLDRRERYQLNDGGVEPSFNRGDKEEAGGPLGDRAGLHSGTARLPPQLRSSPPRSR